MFDNNINKMSKKDEKNIENKEDLSSIDSLSENDILLSDEEEEKEMLSFLSDMVFTAPYEKYVINTINKIFKDNYEVKPLFMEKKYSLDEIFNEFDKIYSNLLIKEKKKLNRSEEIEFKNNSLISNSNNSSYINNLSGNIKFNESSSNSLKFKDSKKKKKENKKKLNEEINLSSFINNDDNVNLKTKDKKKEINDFLDTFNLSGEEFELHIKKLLIEILKCFELDKKSYKLLYNINFKSEENIFGIKQIEIDFLINNIDNNLFIKFINYLKNNILLMQFRGKKYEINIDKNIEIISAELTKIKKFDILGEIGLNAINDENKIKQFIQYSKILNYMQTNENINDNFIKIFYDKTGFCKENEKILFFITDSKFKDIYKTLKESILYKEMKNVDENINFILCYISNGFYEKLILNNFLNKKNENKENKTILEKIRASNESVFKSEKFKKLCNKLNEIVNKLNKIEKKFMKNNSEKMENILGTFNTIILNYNFVLNKNFDEIIKKYNNKSNTIEDNKNSIKNKFIVLYFVNNYIIPDEIIEILNNMKIKFTTINLDKINDSSNKNEIDNFKKIHKLDNIYLFIVNCFIINERKATNYINNLIEILNIRKTNYIFLLKPKKDDVIKGYEHTFYFNIKISTNKEQFEKQYKDTEQKIISYYPNINEIYANKKLFDLFIKIFLQKNKEYVKKKSNTNEIDLIQKINEIYYFILNFEIKDEQTEYFSVSNFKNLFEFIDQMIESYIIDIKKDYTKNYESVFNEIEKYFLPNKKTFFESTKTKIKKFFNNYLKRYVLNSIYNNFIDIVIPELSSEIFDQKIKNAMLEKEKLTISNENIKENNNSDI